MDSRRLLDRMPPGQPAKRAVPPVAGGGASIESLPDGVLEHILGFLPSAEAVQTSVLARRWRHLWKSATGLRIGFQHGDIRPPSVDSLRHFVNHLLLLRKRDSCLHTCELRLRPRDTSGWLVEERISLNLWTRHVVEREVRMLRLEIHDHYFTWPVSQHLKMLALINVWLNSPYNFSNCPNLEHL